MMHSFKHLHFFFLLLLSTLFAVGCGSNQDYIFTNPTTGSETTTIRLEQTLLRAVPNAVTHQRFSGYDLTGVRLYGPETRPKNNPIILEGVPVAVAQLEIEYLVEQTVIATVSLPVNLQPGVTYTLQDPEFSVVLEALVDLEVTPSSTVAGVGEARQFKAIGISAGQAELEITKEVTWSSSKPNVVEINSQTGLAVGKSSGTATITATVNNLTAEATFEVTSETIAGLTIDPPAALSAPGTTRDFTATLHFANGDTRDATEMVTWSSDNANVEVGENTGQATISLAAATPSSATITASLGSETQKTATLSLGSYIYFAREYGIAGFQIDTDNGALNPTMSVTTSNPTLAVVVDPSGRFAYSAEASGIRVFEIEPQTGALTQIELETSTIAGHLAMHPSGKFLYSFAGGSPDVSIFTIDPETGALDFLDSVTISGSFLLADMAIHPSGRTLYLSESTNTGVLHILDVKQDGRLALSSSNAQPGEIDQLAMDPLGRFMYLSGVNPRGIYIAYLNSTTGAFEGLTDPFVLPGDPTPVTGENALDPFGRFAYLTKDWLLSAHKVENDFGAVGASLGEYDTVTHILQLIVDPSGRYIFWGTGNPSSSGARGAIDQGTGAILSPTAFSFGTSASLYDIAVTP